MKIWAGFERERGRENGSFPAVETGSEATARTARVWSAAEGEQ
ncbi:MAG: hypothetical protein AAB474_02025 [Patescibacteria group bacterium]